MSSTAVVGERFPTRLAAVFGSQQHADAAIRRLVSDAAVPRDQIDLVKPDDPGPEKKLEPESRGIARTGLIAHAKLGLAGLLIGAVLMLGAGGALAASQEQGKMSAQRETGSMAEALPDAYKLSNWIGKPVQNEQGDKLGTVKELVMDDYGIVRYTIMEREGDDQKLVAVPMGHFQFPLQPRQDLVLNVTPQMMQAAPGFESTAYPNMGDEEWTALVITYWLPEGTQQQAQAGQQGQSGAYDANRDMVYLSDRKEQLFEQLDKDNDAAIEPNEAQAHERVAEKFEQLDTYRNKRLTRSEFAALELREDEQQGGASDQQRSDQQKQGAQQP